MANRWNAVAVAVATLTMFATSPHAEPETRAQLAKPAKQPKAPKLSSAFTSVFTTATARTDCKQIPQASSEVLKCPAQRGYAVEITFSGWGTDLGLTGPGEFSTDFSGYLRGRLEWRLADGKPFAVILEVDEEEDRKASDKPKPIQLHLRGLAGFENLKLAVDATPGAVEKMRLAADTAFRARLEAVPPTR